MGGNPQITPIPIDYIRYEPGVKTTVAYTNKGTVSAYEDLPSTSNLVEGDMYQVGDTDDYYVWDGRYWNLVTLPESGGNVEHITWHQCPEVVRNYLAEAQSLYPTAAETVTCVNQYAPTEAGITEEISSSYTKPLGYTVDGVTYYDNEPNVAEPFATATTAGTLTALDKLRWYNTTPAAPAAGSQYKRGKNCRDLGGWNADGGTVKYGLLVRGSEPNPVDKELMVDKVGIKTEVQLLPISEQGDDYTMVSPWGIDWAGNDTNVTVYSPEEVSDPAKKALWTKILSDIIDSVIHYKPVYFHCGIGADRTGVVAVMLEGILGVSRSDIDIDFELTNFSQGWKTIHLDVYDADYIYRSRSYPTNLALMHYIENSIPLVGGLTDSFRNRCISFALSLGIPVDKINLFRSIMIDGNPEQIVVIGKRTITNNLVNCTTNNSSTEVDDASAYTATITPDDGFTLNNAAVTITMGGEDASQYYSQGVLSIPSVMGDVSISITAVALPNLFDSSTALYNYRIRGVGAVGTRGDGKVVTAPIDITNYSTLTISGITEVKSSDNAYLAIGVYSSSVSGESDKLYVYNYPAETYVIDVASLKTTYPTATHMRLCPTISTSAITSADTTTLAIYGT